MEKDQKREIANTDINLSVNYMIIEAVLRIMGIKDYVFEEHQAVEVFVKDAADFKLRDRLEEYRNNDVLLYNNVINELVDLFDLPKEIFTGERQFNLGIEITPYDKELQKESKMNSNRYAIHCKENDAYPVNYNTINEVFIKAENVYTKCSILSLVDEAVKNNIGNNEITTRFGKEHLVKQLYFNPLGLNEVAVFNYIYDVWETVNENDDEVEIQEKQFFEYFASMSVNQNSDRLVTENKQRKLGKNKKNKAVASVDEEYNILIWRENVYSIQSLIYNVLLDIDKIYEKVCSKHLAQDIIKRYRYTDEEFGDVLPYPLVFSENEKGAIISELKQLIETLHETHYDCVIQDLAYEEFGGKETDIFVLVNDELKYYQDELGTLRGQEYSKETDLKIEKIEEQYIPKLEQYYESFKQNKQEWAKEYAKELFERKGDQSYIPGKVEPTDGIDKWFDKYTKLIPLKTIKDALSLREEMETARDTLTLDDDIKTAYEKVLWRVKERKGKNIKAADLNSFDQWIMFMQYKSTKPYILALEGVRTENKILRTEEQEVKDKSKAERARGGRKKQNEPDSEDNQSE